MDAQSAAAAFGENGKVTAGLRGFHDAKRILLAGDRQILGILAGNLQEDAAVGAALVGLSGGMQKARAEAENGGDFFLVANGVANTLQKFVVCRIHSDVAEDAKIIARPKPQNMRLQNGNKSRAVHCGYIFLVGEEFDAAGFEKWNFWRKASGRFVLAGQFFGFDLAGFDVRLVEGVDANDLARDGRGDFPAEKFLAESISVRQSDSYDRMPGLFQGGNRGILSFIGLGCQT